MNGTKKIVFAITTNALAVLIVTLVNFILFVRNKDEFKDWCVGESWGTVQTKYADNNATSTQLHRLDKSTDVYNCERLFQDEVKWGLICLIVMFVVYVSILIFSNKFIEIKQSYCDRFIGF